MDRINLILAGVLFISPWMMGYTDLGVAAKAAWISAIVVALVSTLATLHFAEWEEWVSFFAGLWLVAAPWLLGFHKFGDAVAAFTGIGAIVASIAVSELWDEHYPRPATRPSEPPFE